MGRPPISPVWATDATYAAGGDPWSGTPNKSAPSAGKVQSGLVPATPLAAEEYNSLFNTHGGYIATLDSAILSGGMLFSDDFFETTISDKWTTSGTTVSSDASSTAGLGGVGVLLMTTTAGTENVTSRETIRGTSGDFVLSARLRAANKSTATVILDIALFGFAFSNASANWRAIAPTASTNIDTGVAVSAGYQKLVCVRNSGVLYWLINDVVVAGPVTDAASLNGGFNFEILCNVAGAAGSVKIDKMILWCAR